MLLTVNGWKLLTIFVKISNLDVWLGSGYIFDPVEDVVFGTATKQVNNYSNQSIALVLIYKSYFLKVAGYPSTKDVNISKQVLLLDGFAIFHVDKVMKPLPWSHLKYFNSPYKPIFVSIPLFIDSFNPSPENDCTSECKFLLFDSFPQIGFNCSKIRQALRGDRFF